MITRLVVAALALLVPAAARGQDALVKGLTPAGMPTVFVLDDTGVETRGRLVKLDDDAVVILVGGVQQRFELPRVNRITRRGDSLKNGAIAGAVAGVFMGSLGAWLSDCPGSGSSCGGWKVFAVTLSTAFYTAVGTGIDAMIQGRTVIYQAPTVRIKATPGGASAAFTLRW